MKQTALYFNPELDTVHIVDDQPSTDLRNLSDRTDEETIQSIKALAIVLQDKFVHYIIAQRLLEFERLETLILVVDGGTEGDGEESSFRERTENKLVKVRDYLVLHGNCKERKLPAVKVMTPEAFENHL
jgi:hypothetical protein